MNMHKNLDATDKKAPGNIEEQPLCPEGRVPAMIDPPQTPDKSPTQKPSETPREPNEMPGAPPREVPRQPLPTERDRERAENEGMIVH